MHEGQFYNFLRKEGRLIMKNGWTTIHGNHVMVRDNVAMWAIDEKGWSADIYVNGDVMNGKITVRKLREMLKSKKAIIK